MTSEQYDPIKIAQNLPSPIMREERSLVEALESELHASLRGSNAAMLPMIVQVPAAEMGDWKPGHPAFDAAMDLARDSGSGVLLLPQEMEFPPGWDVGLMGTNFRYRDVCPECSDEHCPLWLPLRGEIAHSDIHRGDLARMDLRQAHDISESCTVCGGDGCDMFFCYADQGMEKA